MFKLDETDQSDISIISFIEQIKLLNDDLFQQHNNCCNPTFIENLQAKQDKLYTKIRQLEQDKEHYKCKYERLMDNISGVGRSKIEVESLNINYNNQPYFTADKVIINDMMGEALHSNDKTKHLNNSRSKVLGDTTNKKINSTTLQYSLNNNYSAQQSNNTNVSNTTKSNQLNYNTANNLNFKKLSMSGKLIDGLAIKPQNNLESTILSHQAQRNMPGLISGNTEYLTSRQLIDRLHFSTREQGQTPTKNQQSKVIDYTRDLSGNRKNQKKVSLL